MKKLIISSVANSVFQDGISLVNLPLTIPAGIKALYWIEDSGWIENVNENNEYIGNTDISELPSWVDECIQVFRSELAKSNVAPNQIDLCKTQAILILRETDWVELPSVTDPTNTPYLLNKEEFLGYRKAIRALAVNPVDAPTWPTPPIEQWSN